MGEPQTDLSHKATAANNNNNNNKGGKSVADVRPMKNVGAVAKSGGVTSGGGSGSGAGAGGGVGGIGASAGGTVGNKASRQDIPLYHTPHTFLSLSHTVDTPLTHTSLSPLTSLTHLYHPSPPPPSHPPPPLTQP